MATKAKKRELDLSRVLKAIDQKNYNFYNSLTDKEKKEFNAYVMMRFLSNSTGDADIQEWFVEMTNECVNKNYWDISKHTDLTWKLCSTVGIGTPMFHQYLPAKKITLDKFENLLGELYPAMKLDDVKMLAAMMTDADREELFDKMGFDTKQRKEYR
jgi:hypothetical protein